jgi:hypothetical protein
MKTIKNHLLIVFCVLVFGGSAFWGLPFWMTAVGGLIGAWFFRARASGLTALFSGFFLWFVPAFLLNRGNGGVLAAKVGALFMGLTPLHLLLLTGLLGGLLAGLGHLTGRYLHELIIKPKPKRWR